MARVLGLDLGGYSLKGLVLEATARSGQVRAYAEVLRPEGDRTATLRAALQDLFANHPLQSDQVVVALPGPAVATHLIALPFSDAKRIDATLPFELESQLPFDVSEVVFDYQLAGQHQQQTDLVVGLVRKEEMRQLLAALAEFDIDPRVVTHPALAYHGLFLADSSATPPASEAESMAIVDIGHERTTVAIGRAGVGVGFARIFPGGGKDLSRTLAGEFQIPVPDANVWKEAHGALASAVHGPDAARAAAAFIRALQPVVRELRSTFKAYSARERRPLTRVLLCGGTSRLAGLDEQLELDLGISVGLLALPPEDSEALSPGVRSAAQSYALAQRGQLTGAKAPRFNLRRGDFAFKGEYDYVRERSGRLAAFGAVLVGLLAVFGVARSVVLGARERQLDGQLCELTQRVLGQCERNYDRALNMLRGRESPSSAIPKSSAVTLLAALTDRIPTDVATTFDQIQVDFDRITLRGETDNSKQVDKITSALKAYRCFHEIKQGKVEKSKTGNKVTFHLDIQVECPDQAVSGQG